MAPAKARVLSVSCMGKVRATGRVCTGRSISVTVIETAKNVEGNEKSVSQKAAARVMTHRRLSSKVKRARARLCILRKAAVDKVPRFVVTKRRGKKSMRKDKPSPKDLKPLPPARPLDSPNSDGLRFADVLTVSECVYLYYDFLAPGRVWEASSLSADALMQSLTRACTGDSEAGVTLGWLVTMLSQTAARIDKKGWRQQQLRHLKASELSVRLQRGQFTQLTPQEILLVLITLCNRVLESQSAVTFVISRLLEAERARFESISMHKAALLDERAAEQEAAAKAMFRCTPLGFDRDGSRYWSFESARPGIYVERGWLHVETETAVEESSAAAEVGVSEVKNLHPKLVQNQWFVYDNSKDIDALLDALHPSCSGEAQLAVNIRQLYPRLIRLITATAAAAAVATAVDTVMQPAAAAMSSIEPVPSDVSVVSVVE